MKDEDWKYISDLITTIEPIPKHLVTGKRGCDESFEDFRVRRKVIRIAENLRAKGTMFINPTNEA